MEQPIQLSQQQFQELLGRLSNTTGTPNDAGGVVASPKNVKPVRPSIDIDTTEGEWSLFEDNWSRFKRMAKLTDIIHPITQQKTARRQGRSYAECSE